MLIWLSVWTSQFWERVASLVKSRAALSLEAARVFRNRKVRSRFQVELMEFLRRCAVVAEVIDRRAGRREGEVFKRFGEHLVQILPGGRGRW